ncbi:MAG: serine/threonine protein kinase [Kiritimatiellia bacterium]
MGITFHRRYRSHPAIGGELREVLGFLEQPNVCDLVEIVKVVPESGAFIYPTGAVTSLAEVLNTLSKMGEPAGIKAGVEICYLVAQILQAAAQSGEEFGLYNHGDLSPWRIVCKSDGQVQLLGYGLPQVEIMAFREDEGAVPKEASFRYCPPERLEGQPEDFSSDLFSLALIAFEMMTGTPLYSGSLSEIRQQATNAQGPYRLYQYRDTLPEPVLDLLSRCLKYDVDTRHADLNEFVWEVRDVLSLPEVDGPGMQEVLSKVKKRLDRAKKQAFAIDDQVEVRKRTIEEVAEEEEDDGPRWGRVARSGGRESTRRSTVKSSGGTGRDRLRGRLKKSSGAETPADSAKSNLKDRLRRSRGREDPPKRERGSARQSRREEPPVQAPEPVPEPPAEEPKKGRASSLLKRLRSSSRSEGDTPASAPTSAAAPAGVAVEVSIDGAASRTVRVEPDDLVCVLVWKALTVLGGPPMSFTGAAEGWFEAQQGGATIAGDTVVAALDNEKKVELVYKDAKLVPVDFEVEDSNKARFRAPLNTGLTAGAVLDQVLRSLELRDDDWHIAVGGKKLHPLQVLGEVVGRNPLTVVIRK